MEHDNHAPKLPATCAPWWMDGKTLPHEPKEPAFLVKGLHQFWQRLSIGCYGLCHSKIPKPAMSDYSGCWLGSAASVAWRVSLWRFIACG